MYRLIVLFVFGFVVLLNTVSTAQNRDIRLADRDFSTFHFSKAIEGYKKVLDKDSVNEHAIKRLADSYRLTDQFEDALKWYEKAVKIENVEPIYYFYYAQVLRSKKQYDKAKEYYLKYLMDNPSDIRARTLYQGMDSLQQIINREVEFEIYNLPINTESAEFSPAYYKDESIVFPSSVMVEQKNTRNLDSWTDRPFLNLQTVTKLFDSIYTNPQPLPGKVNQRYHEGPLTFNSDFTEMYFTRNYYNERSRQYDRDGILKLEIFHAKLADGIWEVTGAVPFSSKEFSNAHPTLTPDGNTMYFSSDREGGYGKGDIYVVHKTEDGSWGEPENLGSDINTEGEEAFPFIHSDGTLYFSSKGKIGLGGFDIYRATPNGDGWDVENVGPPINSPYDDFGFITDEFHQSGYFSSNRPEGKGSDDIYGFTRVLNHELKLFVYDSLSEDLLHGALVIVEDLVTGERDSLLTNEEGSVQFDLTKNPDLQIYVSYERAEKKTSWQMVTDTLIRSTLFKKNILLPRPLETIADARRFVTGSVLELENLYYDYDKYHIRADAAEVLDELLLILETYPEVEIKLMSHTDSRGSLNYNKHLSMRRAQSARNYLVSAGIDPARLSFEGYGQSKPVNHCVDGVECTEEEHQLNRRTEIKVVRGINSNSFNFPVNTFLIPDFSNQSKRHNSGMTGKDLDFNLSNSYKMLEINHQKAGAKVEDAKRAFILVHGRGGTAEDILNLGKLFGDSETILIAPQAEGNTWYPYSFMAAESRNEPFLSRSLGVIKETYDYLKQYLDTKNIYLLGFSQGACLTSEFAATHARKFGGLLIFTGGLIGEKIDERKYEGNFEGTKVYLSNGDNDPHIPVERSEETKRILTELGAEVKMEIFPGRPHTINQEEIEAVNKFMGW
ncbi:MAG: hypothetical protein EA412_02535 [Chitinophagaceae bacterium]|nr:MAG: hypothetical protein EA412_02535 [Chitinophagaceae bacterium]